MATELLARWGEPGMNPQMTGLVSRAFLVALAVLVVVHEMGHYLAARLQRQGAALLPSASARCSGCAAHGRDGTEWAISAFPLGGYVKMLDEREGEVAAAELPAPSTGNRSVGAPSSWRPVRPPTSCWRSCSTGSLFMHGVTELKPRLALPPAGTPAAAVGIAEGMHGARGEWHAIHLAGIALGGDAAGPEQGGVKLEVISRSAKSPCSASPAIASISKNWKTIPCARWVWCCTVRACPPWWERSSRARPPPIAGFRDGDRVLSIDGKAIADWGELAAAARRRGGQAVCASTIERDGGRLELRRRRDLSEEGGRKLGRLG
jgi:regulator of sigma E protease